MIKNSFFADEKSVVFLFINGPHHVYHAIIPALTFAKNNPDLRTIIVSGNRINLNIITYYHLRMGEPKCEIVSLPLPWRYKILNYKNKLYRHPSRQWEKIHPFLKESLAVVSTSHDAPHYFAKYKITKPKLFYLFHGTGTREYGFELNLNQFDLLMIPGPYHKKRLNKDASISKSKLIQVGYTKNDTFQYSDFKEQKLFPKNQTTFYYNPHWDVELSSLPKWGRYILDYFKNHSQFNLIFAPHPLVKHYNTKYNLDLNYSSFTSDNTLIDFDSQKNMNGFYCIHADIYLGDVSSMLFEWINYKPRPCIFINTNNIEWENDENYSNWRIGHVINSLDEFNDIIGIAIGSKTKFAEQISYKNKMIYKGVKSPSEIAANAITSAVYEPNIIP